MMEEAARRNGADGTEEMQKKIFHSGLNRKKIDISSHSIGSS
jgi:hypothetical protein